MGDSILNSVKKLLGIDPDDTYYDMDLIIHINAIFSSLTQMGVGPEDGFSISDNTSVWSDYINDTNKYNMLQTYMYLKVKSIFDPSLTSSVADAYNRIITEYEWRMVVEADNERIAKEKEENIFIKDEVKPPVIEPNENLEEMYNKIVQMTSLNVQIHDDLTNGGNQ